MGFTVRNSSGFVSVTSDVPPLIGIEAFQVSGNFIRGMGDGSGDDNIPSAFGTSGVRWGTLNSDMLRGSGSYSGSSQVLWLYLADQKECSPGGWYQRDAGILYRSVTKVPTKGSYLNVYDANGTLTWSVESCLHIPKILGEIYVPASLAANTVMTFTGIPTGACFLVSSFYTNYSSTGDSTGYGMTCIRREGTNIKFKLFVSGQNVSKIGDIYPDGVYIPYASIILA